MPTSKLSGVVCVCNFSVSSWGQAGPWGSLSSQPGTVCELSERPCLKKVGAIKEDWQQSPRVCAHTWLDCNELIHEAFKVCTSAFQVLPTSSSASSNWSSTNFCDRCLYKFLFCFFVLFWVFVFSEGRVLSWLSRQPPECWNYRDAPPCTASRIS